ncbi:NCK-interacting protein with SH3 domain-like isoform X2 [Ornithodoros turicata]|uniref:NCK-interacting protein with SH3 domain-like isoform X2 n=1 Tax=Ornithodoros turicata TaxID=34597 RepID=UPI003139D53E
MLVLVPRSLHISCPHCLRPACTVAATLCSCQMAAMASAYLAKSLYDYESKDNRLLSFKQDEKFIVIEQLCKDPNWYYAVNEKGIAGFVPVTYMLKEESDSDRFLELVEKALDALQNTASCSKDENASCMSLQRKALRRLHHLKESLRNSSEGPLKDTPKETALGHQSPSDFLHEEYSRINAEWISENLARAEPFPEAGSSSAGAGDALDLPMLSAELIEEVRRETQLSHASSRNAVLAVLHGLAQRAPRALPWGQLVDSVLASQDTEKVLVTSRDGERLRHVLRQLWYCKNDDQQRSWPIHEDESHIAGLLEELYTLLVDADPRVCREMIRADEYDCVTTLVLYYQMEPRCSLRVWMLRVFLTLCELDLQVVSLLLYSVLPLELARDLQANTDDIERMKYTALLLTVIFSTGENPPNNIYEHIGEDFVKFLVGLLEAPEAEEEVAELAVGAMLALNLHQISEADNFVLRALRTGPRDSARALAQRLVLFLNREDDPARVLTHELNVPNSVLKILVELFADPATAELFYTNDVSVLVDIIARQLSDLQLGDKRRPLYLRLVGNVVKSTAYEGHKHQELSRCFQAVLSSETVPAKEATLVEDVRLSCPQWFLSD